MRPSFDGPVTLPHTSQKYALGTSRIETVEGHEVECKYVKFVNAVDVVAGHVLGLTEAGPWQCSPDRVDGTYATLTYAGANKSVMRFGGIALCNADISEGEIYGWVLWDGYCTNFLTDEGVAKGEALVLHLTTDGAAETAIAETDGDPECDRYAAFGFADADDTAAVGTGYIHGR